MREIFHLIAILPPSNIGQKIIEIQKKLFYSHGLTAGLTFPPLIPVTFLGAAPADSLFKETIVTEDPITSTLEWTKKNSTWYLKTSNKKTWQKIKKMFEENRKRTLFPPCPGIVMYTEQSDSIDEKTACGTKPILPPAPSLRWRTSRLAVIRFETSPLPLWWKSVLTTVLRETKLRLS